MPVTKKTSFSEAEQSVADIARVLSHPARVAILAALAHRNSCVCGEIVEVLPLAQSTVSQHLKALKDAGLITGTVDGVKSCYCINWEAVSRIKTVFNLFVDQMQAFQCC
jgi:ArsR family transcriptional regulator, arsenate/arsenite/antimonite-responsive transcriptional repressor